MDLEFSMIEKKRKICIELDLILKQKKKMNRLEYDQDAANLFALFSNKILLNAVAHGHWAFEKF